MNWNPVSCCPRLLPLLLIAGCAGTPTNQAENAEAQGARVELADAGSAESQAVRRIEPGDYFRPARGGSAVIKIEGQQEVILDLTGVSLRGTPEGSAPDEGQGIGIWIQDCVNVQVIGGTLGGYRVALVVENSEDVRVEGLSVDPVFGHRVAEAGTRSAQGKGGTLFGNTPVQGLERSGAAIAIVDSSEVQVSGVTCRGGQNGAVLVRSESCTLEGNDFSFLSGFGIALEDSDQNILRNNRCNFVAREADGGAPEDPGSSGFVLAGDSSSNLIVNNWAQGGNAGLRELSGPNPCRSNRIVGNDFSGTSTVGAFLRGSEDSWFLSNLLEDNAGAGIVVADCQGLALKGNLLHGVRGTGLALQGGARAGIRSNEFVDCDVAIQVNGGGDGLGLDHWFGENAFSINIQDLVLEEASGVEFFQNEFQNREPRTHLDGLTAEGNGDLKAREVWAWLGDAQGNYPSGRSYRSQIRRASPQAPAVLGQAQGWLESSGWTPVAPGGLRSTDLQLGDFGPVDPDHSTSGGRPSQGALERMTWDATWFTWDPASDPRGDLERWRAGRFEPLLRREVSFWTHPWGADQGLAAQLPQANYGLIATGTLEIQESGEYRLSARSDDGVRVTIDGEPVLEDWTWHPERRTSEKINLEAGSHSIELEYFQLDGPAVLTLDLDGPL